MVATGCDLPGTVRVDALTKATAALLPRSTRLAAASAVAVIVHEIHALVQSATIEAGVRGRLHALAAAFKALLPFTRLALIVARAAVPVVATHVGTCRRLTGDGMRTGSESES